MTRVAIIAALPGELKPLVQGWPHSTRNGIDFWILARLTAQISVGKEPIEQAAKSDSLSDRLVPSRCRLRRRFAPNVQRCGDLPIFPDRSAAHLTRLHMHRYLIALCLRE